MHEVSAFRSSMVVCMSNMKSGLSCAINADSVSDPFPYYGSGLGVIFNSETLDKDHVNFSSRVL